MAKPKEDKAAAIDQTPAVEENEFEGVFVEKPKKLTKDEKQALSGKGKTRVEIAQDAVDRLKIQLAGAEARLAEAIAHAAAAPTKAKQTERKKLEKAMVTLEAAGMMNEARAVAAKIAALPA